MADWAKLIEAIAGLVGAVAWPVAVVLAVWLIMRRHRDAFGRLIDRVSSLQFPGGQIDLAAVEAKQEEQVATLAGQVVSPELDAAERQDAVQDLVAAAESLGRIRGELDKTWGTLSPREQAYMDLVVQDLTDRQIAQRLGVRLSTVHTYMARVQARTGLRARAEIKEGWARYRNLESDA
ncbi:LuxR C-terminal-related transcriptional regulator [Nonomuraea sp. NPDC001831]|uniref:helix-turn-helix transcriptional regulator n=1 Tax=Nonomuraea sp. NPDC001831 TaxID=3364340 RepID=UPI0036A1DEBF